MKHNSDISDGSPIAVFDSGVGGLSVLREVYKLLPNERFLYIADTAHLPYGSRLTEDVIAYSRHAIHLAIEMGAKLVLVACNTSAVSIPNNTYSEFCVPVLNIVSSFTHAKVDFQTVKRAAVIATPLTIRSNCYQNMIRKFNPQIDVVDISCPMLVPVIENEIVPLHGVKDMLLSYFSPILERKVDTLVYGCSHYGFLEDEIRQLLGKNLRILNPAVYFAEYVMQYIREQQILIPTRLTIKCTDNVCTAKQKDVTMNTAFFVTGNPITFAHNVHRLLKFKPDVKQVTLYDQ